MRALSPRVDDSALLRVLEASIETLQAENEILKRRLADAETRAAQGPAKAEEALAEKKANVAIVEIDPEPPIQPAKRRWWPRLALLGRWEAS